jgi:hypothetical protein
MWAESPPKNKIKIKELNMKTMNRKSLLVAGVSALALSFGSVAYAEKGAETLARLSRGDAPAKAQPTAAVAAHKCANCTDTLATRVDKGTKGPNHLVTKVVQHNCKECSTTTATKGTGKAAKEVAIHTCGADVKAACCATN